MHATAYPATTPTPDQVRAARLAAGHTQQQAAELVHLAARVWRYYEAGDRAMQPAVWALYRARARIECETAADHYLIDWLRAKPPGQLAMVPRDQMRAALRAAFLSGRGSV